MPALPSPDMQIGALPQGFSPLPSAGPSLQYGFNTQPPVLVQQVSGASTVAAPANFTLAGISATKVGSYLVAVVALATSASPTINTPTNWTSVANVAGGNAGNTLGGRILVYPNNPGGITNIVFPTLASVNGIAVAFYEFQNVFAIDTGYGGPGNQGFSNSSATPSVPAYAPPTGPVLIVGYEADVTGQAYTPANVGSGWVTGTAATSTTGATVCVIRPFYTITTPIPGQSYQLTGSLAGAIASGASMLSFLCAASGSLTQAQPQAVGQDAAVGAAWGPLGGTKPGGAGSGQ